MPRKEAKTERNVTINGIAGYHCSRFAETRVFASDRPKPMAQVEVPMGYGLEMETVIEGVNNKALYADILKKMVFPDAGFHPDLWRVENDSSLHGHSSAYTGAECVSQVMTKAYIRNSYPRFKAMYNKSFKAYDISCNDYCGMHTNVSIACFGKTKSSQEEAIRKLYYVLNTHYELFRHLFHRDPQADTFYFSPMECPNKDYAKRLQVWDGSGDGSHAACLNLSHTLGVVDRHTGEVIDGKCARVEIRLVGGQPNFAAFRNTMECVFWTVEHICRLPWEKLDDVEALFTGCNQYVYDRLQYCENHGALRLSTPAWIRLHNSVKTIEGLL